MSPPVSLFPDEITDARLTERMRTAEQLWLVVSCILEVTDITAEYLVINPAAQIFILHHLVCYDVFSFIAPLIQ